MLWLGVGTAATPTPDADLRQALNEVLVRHDVAALGVALVNRDKALLIAGLGVADWDSKTPVTGDSLFRIGSITKAFTGLATLALVEDECLQLTDRPRDHLDHPVVDNPWAESAPVRIEQLLEHTAGLADMSKPEWDSKEPLTLRAALAVDPTSRRLRWQPGLHSSYSNTGAGLVGLMLEACSGQGFETLVEERLFAPLGMSASGLLLDARTRRELVTGYNTDGRSVIPYWHMLYRPFGAINTTPRDMAAFLRLWLNDGELNGERIVSPESIRRAEVPRTTLAARAGLTYGYGFGNYQWYRDGVLFHGHGGDGDGYLAHFGYTRDTGLGYFVVINAFKHAALRDARAVLEKFIVARAQRNSSATIKVLSHAQLARLSGDYEAATARFTRPGQTPATLRVSLRGDRLYTVFPERRARELVPVNEWLFRRADQPAASIAFIEVGDELYLQGDLGNFRRTAK